ncbi:hypothetical protein BS47DRAFT_1349190 [Hydnum rufescens UP504]|uniref:Uncharacterized protein n=1 Tax=Hydnum rufescens UP504 TaxID=1448309 RepID=A0A9P6DTC7_9AGAM|nr:hypothetical protein BS47DRAFT_1349190 [Hydnum rufescens UP504]
MNSWWRELSRASYVLEHGFSSQLGWRGTSGWNRPGVQEWKGLSTELTDVLRGV